MYDFNINNFFEFIKRKIASLFCSQECPYCNKQTSCEPIEFIREGNKVKCSHCQRYLETVKESR
ncbi:hypothetical protein [uncultured Ilyobacter sp.]|uniref:hypothetical protein n=1 Tax=uncultured Ilyobacter sp. TaxID=544433 RepID=UPI002AA6CD10|nr:hypothetical protein [uncultured Ilyobacter sp.]